MTTNLAWSENQIRAALELSETELNPGDADKFSINQSGILFENLSLWSYNEYKEVCTWLVFYFAD